MKTIEILSNGRPVQFTTKTVTIAGREYQYSHISELRHSEEKRVYGFKCDGEVVMLPYEEKDTQVLKVIFSQVQQMHRKPKPAKAGPAPVTKPVAEAPAEPAAEEPVVEEPAEEPAAEEPAEVPAEEPVEEPVAEEPAEVPAEEPVEEPVAEEPIEEPAAEEPAEVPAEEPIEEPAAEEPAEVPAEEPAEEPAAEEPAEEPPAELPALSEKEKKRLEKEQRKADKEAAKREKLAKKAAAKTGKDAVTYAENETGQMDQLQKAARFRKAIIIFVIILAVFALMGVVYYFTVGPASDPQIGPNTTDQTQYNDIDDMINDLEN